MIIHARNSHQNGYVHPKGWEYSLFWVCEFVDDLLVIYLFIYLFICLVLVDEKRCDNGNDDDTAVQSGCGGWRAFARSHVVGCIVCLEFTLVAAAPKQTSVL